MKRSFEMNPAIRQTRQFEKTIESVRGQVSLQITFHWLGDRYGHSISAKTSKGISLVCSSVENDVLGVEFSRPVFQELSAEQIGGNEVICLVGKSNRAYWSASIEPLRDAIGFLFDICSKQATAPRSEYELKSTLKPGSSSALMTPLDENWYCEVQPVLLPEFRTRLEGNLNCLEIHGESQDRLYSSRVRWMYRWEIKPYTNHQ